MFCSMIKIPKLLLSALILWLCVSNANAIKCFICDSSLNAGCKDLKSNASITSTECSLEKMELKDSYLFNLNEISYFPMTAHSVPVMYCQKVVAKDPRTKVVTTARFCQIHVADSNPCTILRNKLKEDLSHQRRDQNNGRNENADESEENEFFCSYCDTDECNGSGINRLTNIVLGIVFTITYLYKRIFW